MISNAETQTLPYLQACITEGLRVWPPVASLIYKAVPPEGDTWEGNFIAGGTYFDASAWVLHRSQALYGEDANIFRLERWLKVEVGGEMWKEMQRSVELVFEYGKFGCLGKTIAMIELNKVFAEVCNLNSMRAEWE
jgi:cytochrome P450